VIGDAQGEAAGARITAGAALKFHDITAWLREGISHRYCVRWIDETETAEPTCERRFGAIMINRAYDLSCEPAEITAIMLAHLARAGLEALPLSLASRALLARAAWAGIAALAPESLVAEPDWVADLLDAENSWRALAPERIEQALLGRLSWSERQRLDRIAPARFVSPAGTSHPIDYAARAGPTVELRVQALFGLDVHPAIGDPARPLLLSLTSPAGRPLQTTADLPGFWRGSWADVRREMKGRYPKHRWPEQPWKEVPSLKTRNAFEAERD
jgi:ATP-dependent helicase HrpB